MGFPLAEQRKERLESRCYLWEPGPTVSDWWPCSHPHRRELVLRADTGVLQQQ